MDQRPSTLRKETFCDAMLTWYEAKVVKVGKVIRMDSSAVFAE